MNKARNMGMAWAIIVTHGSRKLKREMNIINSESNISICIYLSMYLGRYVGRYVGR